MDPVTLIVAALTAGAVAGVQGTTSAAVTDAYAALKRLLAARFDGSPAGTVALEQHASRPEQWTPALEGELVAAGADRDDAVVAAARRLLESADPDGARVGRYVVDARGARGLQVGDGNTQHNTF